MDAIEFIESKMRAAPFAGNESAKFAQMLEDAKGKRGKASMFNMLGAVFVMIGFLGAPLAVLAAMPMLMCICFLGLVGGIMFILAYSAKEEYDAAKVYCLSYLAAVEARALSGAQTHIPQAQQTQQVTQQAAQQAQPTEQYPAVQYSTQQGAQAVEPNAQTQVQQAQTSQYPFVPQTQTQAGIPAPEVKVTTQGVQAQGTEVASQAGTTTVMAQPQTTQATQATQAVQAAQATQTTQAGQATQVVQAAQATQATEEKKEEAAGTYTVAPPHVPGTPAWQCGICRGTIKQGLTVILCKCQQPYHDTCGERFGVCVMCGAKLPSKKEKGDSGAQSTTAAQTSTHAAQTTQPTTQTPPQGTKPGPGTVQSEGHAVAQPGQQTIKAGEKKNCAICNGLIKQGLSVVTCACGNIFHAACANRAAECPKCYRKL